MSLERNSANHCVLLEDSRFELKSIDSNDYFNKKKMILTNDSFKITPKDEIYPKSPINNEGFLIQINPTRFYVPNF